MTGHPTLIYWVPFWPLGFFGIWAIWNLIRYNLDEKVLLRSLVWPEAQGKVVSSKLVWAHVEVIYEYSVSTGRYTGKYKMSLTPGVPDRWSRTASRMNEEVKQSIADLPVGADIIVKYNPQLPDQSVFYCKGRVDYDLSK